MKTLAAVMRRWGVTVRAATLSRRSIRIAIGKTS
jgi:hypothetical protein